MRVRSPLPPAPETLELALSAGAISILSPLDSALNYLIPLATIGCVRIIPVMEGSDEGPLLASRVRGAIDEGASIALSPAHTPRDCPGSNGPGGMQSLLHLAVAQFGLTLEEAIVATTYNAVCSLRLSQTTGSIEPGKSADLLLMNVADYRDLAHGGHHNHPGSVMRAGQVLGALH